MKQIQLFKPGGLGNLHLVEVDPPGFRDNEILVKVAASSLNYHDLLVALGSIPTEDKRVLLGDASGEIVGVGTNVTKWQVGDQVISACFPNWIEGPTKKGLLSFMGDNEDGYATEY
ncbi:MAG: alcohol dehydrogenase catalytic domain-containing protein, partial [Proteobacteria bacterium]|nr:alcohol dehydrogenase catalytic domain-containing protein [Pseudomonadota bacterium]